MTREQAERLVSTLSYDQKLALKEILDHLERERTTT